LPIVSSVVVFTAALRYWCRVAYFHLTDGKQVLSNHKGIDLSGNAAAREDALALARDLEVVMAGWN
jgi:hypothetical protein